jgi:hypothetical protein
LQAFDLPVTGSGDADGGFGAGNSDGGRGLKGFKIKGWRLAGAALALALTLAAAGGPVLAAEPGFDLPPKVQASMDIKDVRVGMKGYGMTVFHGVKIEPFEVEVVSIQTDFNPNSGVVWVRSVDPRMQLTGPVAGMSGSPIYLWDEGKQGTLGQGGRLIGAFAFGFAASKDCFVGVQPIAYMRNAGKLGNESVKNPPKLAASGGMKDLENYQLMMAALAKGMTNPRDLERLSIYQKIAAQMAAKSPGGQTVSGGGTAPVMPVIPGPAGFSGVSGPGGAPAMPMSLPFDVGSPEAAKVLGPLLESMGLSAMSGPVNLPAGVAPYGIDAEKIQFQPGGVLAIPLAWGDQSLSAVGTVTDVLPDGTVLGFGHPMFGEGAVSLPMATGYVHFIQPNLQVSFKLGASTAIKGSLIYDDQTAVVGRPGQTFKSSPVKVKVRLPGRPEAVYNYQTVQHKKYGPMMPVMLLLNSIKAQQNLPMENTARLRATLDYGNGRVLKVDTVQPMASPMMFAMQIYPAMQFLAMNPFESMTLQSSEFELDVEDKVRAGFIASAKAVREEIKPGEVLEAVVKIQPFGKPVEERRVSIRIPADMPDGQYNVGIVDSHNYLMAMLFSKPYLTRVTNGEELFDLAKRLLGAKSERIYMIVELPQTVLTVNRQELPRLPGSKASMIASQSSSAIGVTGEMLIKEFVDPLYIEGGVSVMFRVKKDPTSR